jgi:D-alanine-D-alanine ligase-like ATP-grasp enzyme
MNNIHPNSSIALLISNFQKLGYVCESFYLSNMPMTTFTAPTGEVWLTHNNRINYPFVGSSARTVSSNKDAAYALAHKLGARTPITITVNSHDYTTDALQNMLVHMPLVVKPNTASLSHGLTLNISSLAALRQAITVASEFDETVLVQQQIEGEELRFVVLNNSVKAILMRQSPQVIGDNTQTIQQLIDTENSARAAISSDYVKYPMLDSKVIDNQLIDLKSVPADGEVIKLGRGTMIATGASVYNVLEETHVSYISLAAKLGSQLGHGFVVVDMFVSNHLQPLTAENYAFIEFNMSPVLKLFYSCRYGENYDVLADLVPLIDQAIRGSHD